MNERAATFRPRFTDLDKRLILAAVREMHKRDRADRDWRRLTITFGRLCGYTPEEVLDDD